MLFDDLTFYQTFENDNKIPSTITIPLNLPTVKKLSSFDLSNYSSVELFLFKESLEKSNNGTGCLEIKLQEAISFRISNVLCAISQDGCTPCSSSILQDIQSVVNKYNLVDENNIPLRLRSCDVVCSGSLINDVHGIIEKSIIKTFYEPVHKGVFFHFTSASKAKKILAEKQFRFYALEKRKYEGELDRIKSWVFSNSYRDELLKKFFYMSLTNSDLPESKQWGFYDAFCFNKEIKSNEYARLTVQVSCKNMMLRKMNYDLTIWDLFDELENIALKYNKKHFYVNQMSRFAAYSLASGNKTEHETRPLYINNDNSKQVFVEKQGEGEEFYVNMDIGREDHGYTFDIIEIKTMPRFIRMLKPYGVKVRCLLWDYIKHRFRVCMLNKKE